MSQPCYKRYSPYFLSPDMRVLYQVIDQGDTHEVPPTPSPEPGFSLVRTSTHRSGEKVIVVWTYREAANG